MRITGHRLWINLYKRLGLEPVSTKTLEEKELLAQVLPVISLGCGGIVKSQGAVNVDSSGVQVLPPNEQRTYALFINDSDTVIYLACGPGLSLNSGIRLNPSGGSYEMTEANRFTGQILAIHGSVGSKVLTYLELE